MNADDISDYLKRIKDAEELGITAAEVWRNLSPECGVKTRGGDSIRVPMERLDLERCARCKRETAPENCYRSSAGVFCGDCSREWEG